MGCNLDTEDRFSQNYAANDSYRKKIMAQPKRVASFGGCVVEHAFKRLEDFIDCKHFWRATITSLGSQPLIADFGDIENQKLRRFLERETKKILLPKLKNQEFEALFFEFASDFAFNHLKIDETVIPDFRSNVFDASFEDFDLAKNETLSRAEVLRPDSDRYWTIWKQCFEDTYNDLFSACISRGSPVFIIRRYLCHYNLNDGYFIPLEDLRNIEARNIRLRDAYEHIAKYEGISFIDVASAFNFTSTSAPSGGPWEFHPDPEAYISICRNILRALSADECEGERFLTNWMVENARSRSLGVQQVEVQANTLKEQETTIAKLSECMFSDRSEFEGLLSVLQSDLLDRQKSIDDLQATIERLILEKDHVKTSYEIEAATKRQNLSDALQQITELREQNTATRASSAKLILDLAESSEAKHLLQKQLSGETAKNMSVIEGTEHKYGNIEENISNISKNLSASNRVIESRNEEVFRLRSESSRISHSSWKLSRMWRMYLDKLFVRW